MEYYAFRWFALFEVNLFILIFYHPRMYMSYVYFLQKHICIPVKSAQKFKVI